MTELGQTLGAQKMVSDEVLEALAEISANPKNEIQRLIIRVIDLFVCCGFRLGEVLTLPVDCWVEEPSVRVKVNEHGVRLSFDMVFGKWADTT